MARLGMPPPSLHRLTSRHANPPLVVVGLAQVRPLACLEMRRVCGDPLTSRHANPPLVVVGLAQVRPLACLEMRRVCGDPLTSRHANPSPHPLLPFQVGGWPAWRFYLPPCMDSHPGTPTHLAGPHVSNGARPVPSGRRASGGGKTAGGGVVCRPAGAPLPSP